MGTAIADASNITAERGSVFFSSMRSSRRGGIVTDRHTRMFHSLMMLAFESNRVIALRCMKLMQGGSKARQESELMVREKIDAAIQASGRLLAGASGGEIVRGYRRRVAANSKRLGRVKRRARRRKSS